jgi:hypothetical protein
LCALCGQLLTIGTMTDQVTPPDHEPAVDHDAADSSSSKASKASKTGKTGKKSAEDETGTGDGKNTKLSTPLLAVLVAVGALLAGGIAFGGTRVLLSVMSDPCETAKADIRSVIAQYPDPNLLTVVEDRVLNMSAMELRANCTYDDAFTFESIEVFPWLGLVVPPEGEGSLDPSGAPLPPPPPGTPTPPSE